MTGGEGPGRYPDGMRFAVRVDVRLRTGVADPQGATIERALPQLGFAGVADVTVGKLIEFTIDRVDEAAARAEVEDLCARFLANPVIEDTDILLREAAPAS